MLSLPAEAKPPGIPVDLVAKQGIGTSHQLAGQIQIAMNKVGDAARSLNDAAAVLEPLIAPYQAAGQERYLAQVYENLGTTYYLLGYLAVQNHDSAGGGENYNRSIEYLNLCVALGKTSTDQFNNRTR